MLKSKMAKAFDRWMDDFIANPKKFEEQWATVHRHLEQRAKRRKPTYGEKCAAVLQHYAKAA